VGNEMTDGERMVRMETEMISIKGTVLELKTMLTEISKRDEKYVLRETLDEIFRLRDQRSKETDRKVDEMNLKLDQKIDAVTLKIDAGDAASLLKFKELESDKKANRRMLPDIFIAISAIGQIGIMIYLALHK
jgi:hypothetical protein